MNENLIMSSSPHMRSSQNTKMLMMNVVYALLPSLVAAGFIFGKRAVAVVGMCILSCFVAEYFWCFLMKKETTVWDGSAFVTGMLLGMTLPPSAPYYIPILGGFFAIVVAKELFGGLGNNFINPALAGRAFLLASFSEKMTTWTAPFAYKTTAGTETYATPLKILKSGGSTGLSYIDMFFGKMGGSIGEVCALTLIVGFVFLLITGTIKAHTTLSYVATVAILSWIFGYNGYFTGDPIQAVLTGGVLLGGIFMLTDYVTSPTTCRGRVIYGMIAGAITVFIRIKGGYPEGVCYSILLANILSPQIDRLVIPKKYGA